MGLFSAAYNEISAFAKAHPTALLGTAVVGGLIGQGLYQRRRNAPARRAINELTDYSTRLTAARKSGLPPSQWPRT